MEEMEVDNSSTATTNCETHSSEERIISERLAANHICSEENNSDQAASNFSNQFRGNSLDRTRFIRDCSFTDFSNTQQSLDVMETIFSYLDRDALMAAELVCREWYTIISKGMLWKKLIARKVKTNSEWRGLVERRGWMQYLTLKPGLLHQTMYRKLHQQIAREINSLEDNWRNGTYNLQRIDCRSNDRPGVYCVQYDNQKIIAGLRDNTIRIWDRKTLECKMILTGHKASVLCLQFDDEIIVSGSTDFSARIWDVKSGKLIKTLWHHSDNLTHLRFLNNVLVTCSKDRTIAVWYMSSPSDVQLRNVLVGHRAAVNTIDFDEKYIVSASGDRTIKVWKTSSCEFVRTLKGHDRGIACLQYRYPLIVSGSSDNSIRIWNVEHRACLRTLEGHENIVRCIQFDGKYIVSGDYQGKMKIWDLMGALDLERNTESLCLHTFQEHAERVYRLQFDDLQIVSSSHDDIIVIWDFLKPYYQ